MGNWRGGRDEMLGAEMSAVAFQASRSKSSSSSSAQENVGEGQMGTDVVDLVDVRDMMCVEKK
jgi:hypothetical protein